MVGALLLAGAALLLFFPAVLVYPAILLLFWLSTALLYRAYKLLRKHNGQKVVSATRVAPDATLNQREELKAERQ